MAGFFKRLKEKFSRKKIDWDDLEESLIAGDLGVRMAMEIIEDLQAKKKSEVTADDVEEVCRQHISEILGPAAAPLQPLPDRPTVVMVAGVNGVGKTTSAAKLAHFLQRQGHGVVLAAADTFRAAAIEQLQAWGERLGIPVVAGQYKADPSSVCYDGYQAAVARGAAFVICDTAGRLHTRHNLMEELKKTARVLARQDPDSPHESLLVVDATTGSNAVAQAREFAKALDLTGLIVTKLDGSGKGGNAIAIKHELGIPPRFIGTGESPEDFAGFDPERFVSELL